MAAHDLGTALSLVMVSSQPEPITKRDRKALMKLLEQSINRLSEFHENIVPKTRLELMIEPLRTHAKKSQWLDFETFWKTLNLSEHPAGVAVVTLDPNIRGLKSSKRKVRCALSGFESIKKLEGVYSITTTANRQATINFETVRENEKDEDLESLATSFEDFLQRQESIPLYISNRDVASKQNRLWLGFPETSSIFPLPGKLENTVRQDFPGINLPQASISGGFGTVFQLHKENLSLSAISVLVTGSPKVWTTIPPQHHLQLEIALQKVLDIDGPLCEQHVRHQNIYITREFLEEQQIPFSQFIQNPGEVVVTAAGTYHEGFNTGKNLAESINYADVTWPSSTQVKCWKATDSVSECGAGLAGNQSPLTVAVLLGAEESDDEDIHTASSRTQLDDGNIGTTSEKIIKKGGQKEMTVAEDVEMVDEAMVEAENEEAGTVTESEEDENLTEDLAIESQSDTNSALDDRQVVSKSRKRNYHQAINSPSGSTIKDSNISKPSPARLKFTKAELGAESSPSSSSSKKCKVDDLSDANLPTRQWISWWNNQEAARIGDREKSWSPDIIETRLTRANVDPYLQQKIVSLVTAIGSFESVAQLYDLLHMWRSGGEVAQKPLQIVASESRPVHLNQNMVDIQSIMASIDQNEQEGAWTALVSRFLLAKLAIKVKNLATEISKERVQRQLSIGTDLRHIRKSLPGESKRVEGQAINQILEECFPGAFSGTNDSATVEIAEKISRYRANLISRNRHGHVWMELVNVYGFGVLALYPTGSETVFHLTNQKLHKLKRDHLALFMEQLDKEKGPHLKRICRVLEGMVVAACESNGRLGPNIPAIMLERERRETVLRIPDRSIALERLFVEIE